MSRHLRTEILLGSEKIRKLKNATVTVIGLGAVGSYVVEALARAGIGSLRLVDFDKVDVTNINRQLYAFDSTVGISKAVLAAARVRDIDPMIKTEIFDLFVNETTRSQVLDNNPDVVIDAIDSLNPKVQLLAELVSRNIPVISSMGAALKTDPFKIKIGDISKTRICTLARLVRKRLRRQGIFTGVTCIYSTEQSSKDDFLRVNDGGRNILGSLPTITGIFGLIAANAALDLLCSGLKGEKQ